MNRRDHESTPGKGPEHTRPLTGDGNGGGSPAHEIGVASHERAGVHDSLEPQSDQSVPGLVKKLAYELSTLFSQELALAKSEMTRAVHNVSSGVSSMAMGGGVLYAGILFLLGGIMLLLAYWVILPVAALIVGAVVTIVGAIMLRTGKKKMEADSLKPDHTIDSLHKDAELARRKAK